MHRYLGTRWRCVVAAALLLVTAPGPSGAAAGPVHDSSPSIALIVHDPRLPGVMYGVDAVEQVVQSADGGRTWAAIFSPGDPQAPDSATPGDCLLGNYAHVTFLAPDPAHPGRLYVGTEGALGDYQDGGCGNAPGGLFYRPTSAGAFLPLNHGLPANSDARGGGLAWGVRAITMAPLHPGTLYVATDPTFLVLPIGAHPATPVEPGLYRSTDGGLRWQPAFAGIAGTRCPHTTCRYPGSLAIGPLVPSPLLYASPTGFYRSLDDGDHWTLQAALAWADPTRFLVRIDPYRPSLAYVATDRAIYRSADAGLHLARLVRPDLPSPGAIVDLQFGPGIPSAVTFLLRSGARVRLLDVAPVALPGQTGPPTRTPGLPPPSATPSPAPSTPSQIGTATLGWPMPGHDPGQSFASPNEAFQAATLPVLSLHWRRLGAFPAIAVAGKVYAIDASTGQVTAYAARDGSVVYRYHSTGVQGLAAAGGSLYFNRGSEIRIVDAATAAWHFTAVAAGPKGAAGTIGTAVPAGATLFTGVAPRAGASGGRAYAFDARTGRLLWSKPSAASSVPCLAVGTLFLSAGPLGAADSSLIDPVSGAVRRTLKGYGTAQWHTSGARIYAGVVRGPGSYFVASIEAYDTQGRYRWTAHDRSFGAASAALVAAVAPGTVEGLSASDGHRLWAVRISGMRPTSAVAGMQPGAATPGVPLARTGNVQPGSVGSGVVIAGRLVLAQSSDGTITVLDGASGHLLKVLQAPVPGIDAANLLVANGMIYESIAVKSTNGTLAPLLLAFGA